MSYSNGAIGSGTGVEMKEGLPGRPDKVGLGSDMGRQGGQGQIEGKIEGLPCTETFEP